MKILLKKTLFWRIVIEASNGETVLSSETYFSKGNAKRAALRLSEALSLPWSEE